MLKPVRSQHDHHRGLGSLFGFFHPFVNFVREGYGWGFLVKANYVKWDEKTTLDASISPA
jgi:hypothetical protein